MNVYMRRFVLGWKLLGYERKFRARIVNYTDDFVICCRGNADEAMHAMRNMMQRIKLTVNETKTHTCRLPEESYDHRLGELLLVRLHSSSLSRRELSVRFDERCVETEHGQRILSHEPGNPDTDVSRSLNHRATLFSRVTASRDGTHSHTATAKGPWAET
jgi:hypothetical protein